MDSKQYAIILSQFFIIIPFVGWLAPVSLNIKKAPSQLSKEAE
jgi:hypothetical protein